jgi:diadenosine tetraphosphate (Ap4A) HIT family hydrolase
MAKPTPDTFRYFSEPANIESKCIFCKIADGRIKPGNPKESAELIFENDRIVAFDDINPGSANRHLLVVPKEHLKNCWDLKSKLLNEMDDLANKMLELHKPEGAQSRKFFIRPPFNSVYHVHLHIMIGELTDPIWNLRKIGFQSPWFHIITPDQLRKENGWNEAGKTNPAS